MIRWYVGRAQWLALCALEHFGQPGITVRWVDGELRGHKLSSRSETVIYSLLRGRMVRHACPYDDHDLAPDCLIAITGKGLDARLDKRGRDYARKQAQAALS